ncbi:MAG TPA: AbrB/MazE/SpoVT family DNA-binding domain-containing protein [Anaerolineae bacterium]|nr:AbrB/MazE/SpoVT family DNA-binding domain-containing protein [Anaerolineae bacterium]
MKQTVKIVRPLRSGQITIPAEFRKTLDIDEHSLLQIELVGHELHIRPVKVRETQAGSTWARELYELFEPVREEAARYSEREVNADIDKAVASARRKRAKGRS